MDLFRAGGFPMWFILAFGLIALAVGARFAFRPERWLLPVLAALGAAVLFSVFAGTLADFATVAYAVPSRPELANSPRVHLIILQGFGESMSPGILGFSFLSLLALECAVGLRRLGMRS